MTTKNFNVKNGLTTGAILLDAASGNISATNANLGNVVTANYFSGSGNLIANVQAANISGQVANALVAGTVYSNAQPNITSLGTLSSLTSGLITATSGGIKVGNIQDPSGTNTISLSSGNITVTSNVTASYFIGNGSMLTGLPATYSNTNVAAYLPTYTGNITGNIITLTGNITAINANLGNLVTANFFSGAGNLLSNIAGANVSGQVGNALVAGTVYTAAQPNITSVGTLASLTITGNLTSGNANLGNLITANYHAGVLTTGAQPNITSVGTLTSLTVTGNVSSGNANLGNLVTANFFSGAGNLLSNIAGANVSGQVGNALVAGTVYTNAQPNITSVGTLASLTITGNLTSGNANLGNLATANHFTATGNVTANNFVTSGSGGNISGANNITANTFTGNLTTAAQPNITSLGTLSALTVSGDTTITGNLTVNGSFEYANVTSFRVQDPIIEQGGNVSGGALASNDGYDRGQLLHYYSGGAVDAFMGWDNSNAEFAFGSNVSVTSEVVTFNAFGNIRASYFKGNGSALTSLTGGNVVGQVGNALVAGTVYTNAQPNITSVGTLASLTVTANISSGNANLGNLVTANFFSGAGNLLSNIAGANISGQVGNALVAGTVYTNAQPNITSVGTLASLTVTANISSGNANLGNLVTANFFSGAGNLLSNIAGANVSGQVGNALVAGTVYTAAQPNITSVGTLVNTTIGAANSITGGNLVSANYITGTLTTAAQPNITSVGTLASLTVTANISSGNANLGNLVTANFFSGAGNLLSNIQGANVSGQVGNALVAGTVYSNAQPNITSVGRLTTLVVGNATANVTLTDSNGNGFVTATGNITAPYFIGNVVGNISGTLTVPGNNTAVLFNDAGSAGASDALKFDKAANTLTLTGNLSAYNANLGNLVTANFFTGAGNLLSNIQGANVTGAVSSATTAGTVTTAAQPNITSVGTLTSVAVTGNATVGNVKINGGITSNRTSVSVTTNTVIDEFAPATYRSAKYHITAKGTNGYQSAEVLLVQDGTNSYITIYGSICSNATADIVDFSSNINGVSGNVTLYGTTASASTTVNIVPIYLAD